MESDTQARAFKLYLEHEEQYKELIRNYPQGRYYLSECLSEILDWLPRIISNYDATHGLSVYAWSVVYIRCKLPMFLARSRKTDLSPDDTMQCQNIPRRELVRICAGKQYTMNVFPPKQTSETGILVKELVSILRETLTPREFDLLWMRHVEDFKLNQIAYTINVSTTHTQWYLNRLEEYVRAVLNEVIN